MSEVILNEVCELIVDCPHSTANDEGKGYPLVRTPNIGKGRPIYNGMHRVSEDVYNQRNARAIPQENDLIFAREATAGNVALIQKGEKVCLGQRTVLIRPNQKKVSSAFLTYFLLAPKQQYNLLSTANGATVAHVNLPTIRNLKLELPDLPTQHRIATILSRYDSLIENYQKQIKLLEEAAQRLYKEWFVDLHFPGHENTKIVDGVPEGWRIGVLGDVAYESGKKIKKSNRDCYDCYLPIDSLPKHSLTYLTPADIKLAESSLVSFEENDIIFGAMRPYFHKVCFAQSKGLTRTTCFVLNSKEKEFREFLLMLLFEDSTVKHATSISVGTTMPSTRWKEFKSMEVILPSRDVAASFGKNISCTTTLLKHYSSQIRFLKEARDRLLPKLMSREIEV